MDLTPAQEKVLMIVGQLTKGLPEHPADNDEVARLAGLKHHQWSAVDDDLINLGLVSGRDTTNNTELTKAGAAEFRRRQQRPRA